MKNLKVVIVGNSVGLRIRPPGKFPYNKNYGILLEELLQEKLTEKNIFVRNLCTGRAVIWDILKKRNEILNEFPHYYIINFGVSDASTREIPLWYSNIINDNEETIKKKIFVVFHFYVISKIRPYIVRLRGKKTWTSKRSFRKYFNNVIDFLQKGTNARFIIISIMNANKRIEKELPGSAKNYIEYNKILKEMSDSYKARYVDVTDLEHDIYAPDGIHLSLEGHRVVAERVFNIIINEENLIGKA